MVLQNDVVFGSVNANRRHYEAGAAALAKADPVWLARLITRTADLDHWRDAYACARPTTSRRSWHFPSDRLSPT